MTSPAPASAIVMRNVSHFYGDGVLRRQVLYDVSAEIHAGEIVIVVGPSGSGKTTMLTLAGALRAVQQGSMLVLGKELRGATPDTLLNLRKEIGFIFQAHNLLGALSASENVRTGPDSAEYPVGAGAARGGRDVGRSRIERLRTPPAGAAFGRPAAARRHRAGAGAPAETGAGRRAHRVARRHLRAAKWWRSCGSWRGARAAPSCW